mmetsp:Transcript_12626/g.16283  ORF Transcript_12626/g.16283 Transcript_12626/m.16283 type:complete len:119 (-) Transcript_12626:130-486(-)
MTQELERQKSNMKSKSLNEVHEDIEKETKVSRWFGGVFRSSHKVSASPPESCALAPNKEEPEPETETETEEKPQDEERSAREPEMEDFTTDSIDSTQSPTSRSTIKIANGIRGKGLKI